MKVIIWNEGDKARYYYHSLCEPMTDAELLDNTCGGDKIVEIPNELLEPIWAAIRALPDPASFKDVPSLLAYEGDATDQQTAPPTAP